MLLDGVVLGRERGTVDQDVVVGNRGRRVGRDEGVQFLEVGLLETAELLPFGTALGAGLDEVPVGPMSHEGGAVASAGEVDVVLASKVVVSHLAASEVTEVWHSVTHRPNFNRFLQSGGDRPTDFYEPARRARLLFKSTSEIAVWRLVCNACRSVRERRRTCGGEARRKGRAARQTRLPPPRALARTKRGRPAKARGRQARKPAKTGPRGGTTTVTESGMVKKNLWVPAEIAEVLRQRAFDERRS